MKKTKRIISVMLALVLAISTFMAFPSNAEAATKESYVLKQTIKTDNMWYQSDKETLEPIVYVSKSKNMSSKNLVAGKGFSLGKKNVFTKASGKTLKLNSTVTQANLKEGKTYYVKILWIHTNSRFDGTKYYYETETLKLKAGGILKDTLSFKKCTVPKRLHCGYTGTKWKKVPKKANLNKFYN